MKLCKDCAYFRDQRGGICDGRRIAIEPVRGAFAPAFPQCSLERLFGECGLDARNFKEKAERDE